jgi:hypothetical protein
MSVPEIRRIDYADGRWCEQEYVDGKLHGRWTVYRANGRKDWERQYADGRQEGYQRTWDKAGRLIEEMWFHLDVLHGRWKKWDKKGIERIVGDFYVGYTRQAFDETVNPDFNALIKSHYGLEPADFSRNPQRILPRIRRTTVRMGKDKLRKRDLTQPGSFWNHVNVMGVGEEWPENQGTPPFPILQINCAAVPLANNPLSDFSLVTLFAAAGDVLGALGEDIVIRAYRRDEPLVQIEPPCDPLDTPSKLSLSDELISYPDENDLPPGLKVFLEDSGDPEQLLTQKDSEKLNSRLGGWPGWLQSGRLSGFGKYAFQVDSLDVEGWDCGDCTIHYFFRDGRSGGFFWCQEMC